MYQALHVLSCSSYLSTQDNKSLSLVNHGMHDAVEQAIVTAMEKAAIWESHQLNTRELMLSFLREKYRDYQAFKDCVIQCIKKFAADYPGMWIKIDLSYNKLGNDLELLRDLLSAIVTTAHSLGIIVSNLDLSYNELKHLPEHLFNGLHDLQGLNLTENELTNLPVHCFEGLSSLKKLDLKKNRLKALPGHFFADLKNLQDLTLSQNWMSNLHEHLFAGLVNLQELDLSLQSIGELA